MYMYNAYVTITDIYTPFEWPKSFFECLVHSSNFFLWMKNKVILLHAFHRKQLTVNSRVTLHFFSSLEEGEQELETVTTCC